MWFVLRTTYVCDVEVGVRSLGRGGRSDEGE